MPEILSVENYGDEIVCHYTEELKTPAQIALENGIYERMFKERYELMNRQAETAEKAKYMFVSVNPNPALVLLPEFVKQMTKMMSKKWIVNSLYVYEQRGDNLADVGKGFHFHAIIEKPQGKKNFEIMRELKNTANTVCDTTKDNFFNVQWMGEAEKDRKIVYITGRKADPAKHAKQDMDIVFREREKLKSYYGVGIKKDATQN